MYLRPFAIALLLAAAGTASAEIYSWKDANGRIHYSDQPPADAAAKPLKSTSKTAPQAAGFDAAPPAQSAPATPSASAPAAKTWEEKDREFRERRAQQAEAEAKQQKERAEKEAKAQYCADLRRNAAMLERGGRIGRANDKGEIEEFSDAQLKSEADRARQRISKECSG